VSIGNADTVFYTLAFVVPGFVLHSTLALLIPQKSERADLSLLRFLTLSCLNYAAWSWLVYLLGTAPFFTSHVVRSALAWGWIVLGSPVAMGLVFARLSQRDVMRRMLQRLGFNPVHVIPTAWDYKFSQTPPLWVLVTMKDGSTVAGWFGSRSFASSEPRGRDLYIQEVYRPGDGDMWQPVPGTAGILVQGDQVKHVEFWSDDGSTDRTALRKEEEFYE
jgi:hypothetical protein